MFRFKQFIVDDSACAMKVGTDGVLLGAWAFRDIEGTEQPLHCLDIGTGSGLIALMLAQRFEHAQIDAIDLDFEAANQAMNNFQISPWQNRLTALHCSLQQYITMQDSGTYDLIVSNPPYFLSSLHPPLEQRTLARHDDTLSAVEMFQATHKLLSPNGRLAIIIPADAEGRWTDTAQRYGFRLQRICRVRGKDNKPYKRIMAEFVRQNNAINSLLTQTLTLMDSEGRRTADYSQLCNAFYL